MSYLPATGPRESSPAQSNANQRPASTFLRSPQFWILVFCSLIFLLAPGCAQTKDPSQSDHQLNETTAAAPSETRANALPLHLDQNLAGTLDRLLSSADFAHARWGVAVIALKDGKLIYDHNGDQLFTPASNMKVYTTAVALDLLGADYHWRTSVYSANEPDAGVIRGDLVLYGRGAPDLIAANKDENTNSIEELARTLAARGIKHIKGNIVGDESYFRGDTVGDGWQWNDLQWYFGAEASALTVNANSIEVSITSATKTSDQPKVVTNDVDGYVQTTNKMVSVDRGAALQIGVKREPSDNNVVLWGQCPLGASAFGVSLSVHRPSLWAAMIFLRELKAHGISVDGAAQFRDSRVSERDRFKPEGKHELAFVTSKSLGEIIRVTNKFSVNLYAELLLRTLGRERAAMLPTENAPGRERGDDERGVDLVRLWLSRQGINTAGLAIHDGSGLSRLDLVTPQATAQLLEAIRKTNSGGVFTDSLPVAGVDGTLQGRLPILEGRVVAKTGALTYDNSLSGYLSGTDGQVFAFSVICNDFVGHGSSIRLIDQLLLAMSEYADRASPKEKPTSAGAKP